MICLDIAMFVNLVKKFTGMGEVVGVNFRSEGARAEEREGKCGMSMIGACFKGHFRSPFSDETGNFGMEKGVIVEWREF